MSTTQATYTVPDEAVSVFIRAALENNERDGDRWSNTRAGLEAAAPVLAVTWGPHSTAAYRQMERLAAISELIHPCSVPDVFNGYDLCPCDYGGSWPCPRTKAAWIARGLDPHEEAKAIIDGMRPTDGDW